VSKPTTLRLIYPPNPHGSAASPYAPAVLTAPGGALLFVSGANASPLYHAHPHVPEEHQVPNSMREQAHLTFRNIKMSLDAAGVDWGDVIKVTRYLTDMRDMDELNAVQREYLGGHRPASTTLGVSHLTTPWARLEVDIVASVPPERS